MSRSLRDRDLEKIGQLRARIRPVVQPMATPAPQSYRPVLVPLMIWVERGLGAALWWGAPARVPRNAAAIWRSLAVTRRLLPQRRAYTSLRSDLLQLTWLRFRHRLHVPLDRVMGRVGFDWR